MLVKSKEEETFVIDMNVSDFGKIYNRPVSSFNIEHEKSSNIDLRVGERPSASSWYGGLKNKSEAISIIRDGWPDGVKRIRELKTSIETSIPKFQRPMRKGNWSNDGSEVNIDRAMAGNWDNAWRSTKKINVAGSRQFINITVCWGGNCNLSAEELFWTGASATTICDALESMGHRCKITAIHMGEHYNRDGGNYKSALRINIKEYNEPLRINSVAGILCHAGIFRTLGFHAILQHDFDVGYGLGRSLQFDENTIKLDNALLINYCSNLEEAKREIQKAVGVRK